MVSNAIPPWDHNGVLPSIDWDEPTQGDRSPYSTSLVELIEKLGTSEPRRRLLSGLLNYRAALRQAGLVQGHQWINGSFAENVEISQRRPPRDIDIVTFFHIPDGETGKTLLEKHPLLFDSAALKGLYLIDSYSVPLNEGTPEEIIGYAIYWYSLWSHTRNGLWKGYLQIDLSGLDDEPARRLLEEMDETNRGQP